MEVTEGTEGTEKTKHGGTEHTERFFSGEDVPESLFFEDSP